MREKLLCTLYPAVSRQCLLPSTLHAHVFQDGYNLMGLCEGAAAAPLDLINSAMVGFLPLRPVHPQDHSLRLPAPGRCAGRRLPRGAHGGGEGLMQAEGWLVCMST